MKFYIASRLNNGAAVSTVSALLEKKGGRLSYDWTKIQCPKNLDALKIIGESEKKAVFDADCLILLTPAGKSSHVEFGIALGRKIPIFLYAQTAEELDFERISAFYLVSGVKTFVGSLFSFVDFIYEEMKAVEI